MLRRMRRTPLGRGRRAVLTCVGSGLLACTSAADGTVTQPASGPPVLAPNANGLNGRRPFPADNWWNADISGQSVDPNSATLIAACGSSNLHPDFGTVYDGHPSGIPYIVISGEQAKKRKHITFEYADESDPGPYPVPPDAPIEGGPESDGDRHVLIIDRDNWKLYELFAAHPEGSGAERSWKAGSGAIFDLSTNAERPAGWTSADAAGLPVFPGLVRYDETIECKEITHALRFTCRHSRRAYVAPARHFASHKEDEDLPPMGMRVRLKSTVDISGYPATARVILKALKRYGMILADNGGDWFLSGAPDPRWSDDRLGSLKQVPSGAFEVVRMGAVTR